MRIALPTASTWPLDWSKCSTVSGGGTGAKLNLAGGFRQFATAGLGEPIDGGANFAENVNQLILFASSGDFSTPMPVHGQTPPAFL